MKQFNYQTATLHAIAERFKTISNQAYSHLLTYYTKKDDSAMLFRLEQARHLSKIMRLQNEYDEKYGTAEGAI